jgi:hypothetical protein
MSRRSMNLKERTFGRDHLTSGEARRVAKAIAWIPDFMKSRPASIRVEAATSDGNRAADIAMAVLVAHVRALRDIDRRDDGEPVNMSQIPEVRGGATLLFSTRDSGRCSVRIVRTSFAHRANFCARSSGPCLSSPGRPSANCLRSFR